MNFLFRHKNDTFYLYYQIVEKQKKHYGWGEAIGAGATATVIGTTAVSGLMSHNYWKPINKAFSEKRIAIDKIDQYIHKGYDIIDKNLDNFLDTNNKNLESFLDATEKNISDGNYEAASKSSSRAFKQF